MKVRIYIRVCLLIMALTLAACATDGPVSQKEAAFDRSHEITTRAYTDYWDHDLPRVIKLTTEAIEADPSYVWPYSLRGAAYSAQGKFEEAEQDLERAIELSPAFTPAYVNRAILKIRTGRHHEAVGDLSMALAHWPGNLTAIVYMAEALTIKGDIKMACKYIEKAITMGFNDLEVLEKRPGFEGLRVSQCYSEAMKDIYDMSAP